MKLSRKKLWIAIAICALSPILVPVVSKSLPIVRERECHRAFFPKESFQERLKKPPAPWITAQLDHDLIDFKEKKITSNAVTKTFEHIYQTLGPAHDYYHFRILDNKLYKYVPDKVPFSDTDTLTEKALKTLLMYAKVPDCDFILCGMDGVPEHYVPSNFYLVEDPANQAPILAQAKRESVAPKYIILIPDQLCLSESWYRSSREILEANQKISWDQKAPVAIWRGWLSDTGEISNGKLAANYQTTPRFALCKMAALHPECIDAGLTNLDSKELETIAKSMGFLKNSLKKEDHLRGKYLPVLDGHMCTYPGYQWRLLSNSVCFKQESDQIQWFYKALQPYVHYIPVKNDMSDLVEKINWAKEHDEEAAAIADRARDFAQKNLLFEEVYFYLYQTFQEYAKFQAIDFAKLKRETKNDPQWKCIQYRKRLGLKKSVEKIRGCLQSKWYLTLGPNSSIPKGVCGSSL